MQTHQSEPITPSPPHVPLTQQAGACRPKPARARPTCAPRPAPWFTLADPKPAYRASLLLYRGALTQAEGPPSLCLLLDSGASPCGPAGLVSRFQGNSEIHCTFNGSSLSLHRLRRGTGHIVAAFIPNTTWTAGEIKQSWGTR